MTAVLVSGSGPTQAAGARPSGWDVLTPTEQRVALLTSRGLRNAELAKTLFVSPKTIEQHLGRIYRKLGLRSRTELACLVLTGGWGDR
jgi:DNA-binding CsgD family transcriptional regulator